MNKYTRFEQVNDTNDINSMLMPSETILWQGAPERKAFIINASLKMLPIAIIWLMFDGFFIVNLFGGGMPSGMNFIFVPFFLIHLFPVWIWLGSTLTASARWKNTQYAITDKRILMRNGLVGYAYKSVYYTDISNVDLRVGFLDKMLGVGDIYLSMDGLTNNGKPVFTTILDVREPERVFRIVQKAVVDIQADIHYPNALRPENNPGYNTKYQQDL